MPGGPGKRSAARQKPQGKKKKGRRAPGNPAKRAQLEREAAQKAQGQPGAGAFGFDQAGGAADDFELPKELRDLL